MGLGSTAKKVQQLADLAEKLYHKVNEVLERLSKLQRDVEGATEDVAAVRREQREQRAILEALADEQGVDVEAVVEEADVALPEEEAGGSDGGDGTGAEGGDGTGAEADGGSGSKGGDDDGTAARADGG